MLPIHRGDIRGVPFDPACGDEARRTHPAVVVSNEAASRAPNRVQPDL
ncbi:type II toxin-antitoxin system PemK/MazF family toxin [Candidatus Spongiisocius sp.]